MSIHDADDQEMVRLPGIWTVIAKFAFGLSIPAFFLGVTFATWVVSSIFVHDTRITVLERMAMHKQTGGGTGSGNSSATIITGDASKLASDQAGKKGYLTTEEFAQMIGKDPRTVLTYIKEGKITPAPVQDGREWRLAANSRLQPHLAANSGNDDEP